MEVFKDLNNNKAKEFEKLLSSKFSKSKNISEGKIIAKGNHQDLLNSSDTYTNFYNKQLRKE